MNNFNASENILRVILTDGAIRNGYIHFPLNQSIFSSANYGNASGEQKGTLITLVDEFGKIYEDDVRVTGNTGRLRSRFGSYFSHSGAKSGDVAEIKKESEGKYLVRIVNSSVSASLSAQVPQLSIPVPLDATNLEISKMNATNTILYGPPGTGKTYVTAARAVQLCDGKVPPTRKELMARYEVLRLEQRISFVTFHQSFGYEEFIEGLRPHLNSSSQIAYSVVPGVFRKACDSARIRQLVKPGLSGKPLQQRTIFKMSLGASWSEEGVTVFKYALENECVLLGYGNEVDFTGCKNESAIREKLLKDAPETIRIEAHVWAVNYLNNELKIGDIVVVSNGNKSFRGIAEVTGEYEFLEDAPFHQSRPVKWLAVFEPAMPVSEIFDRGFAMQAIYKLDALGLNYEKLNALLTAQTKEPPVQPHVLIIDEINRANISKVFGELITLLEPDKREGETNAISVKLPYSGEDFTVPSNLHVIGTMNTADRSIALLDTALRRRFDFEELEPDASTLEKNDIPGVDLVKLLTALNDRIEALFDRDHRIGHAFFIGISSVEGLEQVFRRKVIPLLQEYFYENWSNVRRALNDYGTGDFVISNKLAQLPADGDESFSDEPRVVYRVNEAPFPVTAYQRIYGGN
ncbi:AAA family ATPase [Polaromonas sp.]|uniref:AAA family ATPase n=1 Tax=Polaromonas sp. TaxID=1869339 RepID=UPI0013BC7381|nr:AAA family ATPase [Polaromonas sp.]NDP62951.1 AAA domain-containing protein [Polaromonas sp.]